MKIEWNKNDEDWTFVLPDGRLVIWSFNECDERHRVFVPTRPMAEEERGDERGGMALTFDGDISSEHTTPLITALVEGFLDRECE